MYHPKTTGQRLQARGDVFLLGMMYERVLLKSEEQYKQNEGGVGGGGVDGSLALAGW